MSTRNRLFVCLILLGFAFAISACDQIDTSAVLSRVNAMSEVQRLVPQVLAAMPHDTSSFTEGLVWREGVLYESAGLYGKSSLRKTEISTGKVFKRIDLSKDYFGEGLALAGERLIELTWHEQVAFIYDADTFAKLGKFSYAGEGWGLCFDGKQFFMSDGSATITARDAQTFLATRQIPVTEAGVPVTMLNELECVDGLLYANVWQTDNIVRIDPATGHVTGLIDASNLLTPEELASVQSGGVLNGIAYNPERKTFLITGKLWPKTFEVQFVPRQ